METATLFKSTHLLALWVPGVPVAKGSLKAYVRPGSSFANLKENNADKVQPWMSCISLAASQAGARPLDGPVVVGLRFHLPRPKGHLKPSGELRATAPAWPTSKPDIDKVTRAVLDALTQIAFTDDARVVGLDPAPYKVYAGERGPGLELSVRAL